VFRECRHIWSPKEWLQVKEIKGDREIETRNISKVICLRCLRIKKVVDREMV